MMVSGVEKLAVVGVMGLEPEGVGRGGDGFGIEFPNVSIGPGNIRGVVGIVVSGGNVIGVSHQVAANLHLHIRSYLEVQEQLEKEEEERKKEKRMVNKGGVKVLNWGIGLYGVGDRRKREMGLGNLYQKRERRG